MTAAVNTLVFRRHHQRNRETRAKLMADMQALRDAVAAAAALEQSAAATPPDGSAAVLVHAFELAHDVFAAPLTADPTAEHELPLHEQPPVEPVAPDVPAQEPPIGEPPAPPVPEPMAHEQLLTSLAASDTRNRHQKLRR